MTSKVFPEITLKGMEVDLKLYAVEHENTPGFSILIDDGYSKVAVAHTKEYEEATEVIQCFMQACAALGFDLESVN